MSQEEASKKRKLDEATFAKQYIDDEAEESDDYESEDDLGSLDDYESEDDLGSLDEGDEDEHMVNASEVEIVSHEFVKSDIYVLEITEDCTFEQLKKLINEQVPKEKVRYGLYTIKYK